MNYLSILFHLSLLFPSFLLPAAQAYEVNLWPPGEEKVFARLPENWQPMTADEIRSFQDADSGILQAGEFIAGYREGQYELLASPVLFVFQASKGQRITNAQREKMYYWFEKNQSVVKSLLPQGVDEMQMQNIEYLHDRHTILFETKVKMSGKILHGVTGIIFLKEGYLNIVGYAENGENDHLQTFYSFIKTIRPSTGLLYERGVQKHVSSVEALFDVVSTHWQRIAGILLFCAVYGVTFLRKGKSVLTTSR